jgi:hypothetical protein
VVVAAPEVQHLEREAGRMRLLEDLADVPVAQRLRVRDRERGAAGEFARERGRLRLAGPFTAQTIGCPTSSMSL